MSSYKYLYIDIHQKLNRNHNINKRINGGWKAYFGFEKNCKSTNLMMWDLERSLFLKPSSLLLSCMGVKFGVATSVGNTGERLRKSISVS